MIIGKFSRTSDGWSGMIQTVTSQTKARFVPNDKRDSDRAPDFRVVAGQCELGVAWRRRTQGETEREYLSVMLDGPFLAAPLNARVVRGPAPGRGQSGVEAAAGRKHATGRIKANAF